MMSILEHQKHRNIMLQILKDIYADTSIAPLLGFKGGTAAYFFYDLNRFSTDLDFDLLDASYKTLVFEKLTKILEKYGQLKDARQKRFTLFFLLSYQPKSYNIKIEINLRTFGSNYEPQEYLGISTLVMTREDMFAHKLVAMYERQAKTHRDIFDVWFFSKNHWPINKKIIEKRTQLTFQQFLKKCIQLLEKKSSRNILSGIGELLDQNQKQWAKSRLLEDTIFLLKLMLEK
ncbi:MAG: nucleotidyl transferase AbiEii/AbiGii toxin family protein [Gammaproteobacteria bacterium]|nr:nucleotidyl transferase AbiEii/AbiGii toxin family protein [Gammaproteobacteria bacterium]